MKIISTNPGKNYEVIGEVEITSREEIERKVTEANAAKEDCNWVNHRDHRNTALSTVDAAYPYSRDLLFFPDQLEKGLTFHICSEFLFVDSFEGPDVVVIDVTDFIETRIKAHASHSSQYSIENATSSADFFTKFEGEERRFERFRYIVAD